MKTKNRKKFKKPSSALTQSTTNLPSIGQYGRKKRKKSKHVVDIDRIKSLYKENYKDHIKNMNHISENDSPQLPKERTHYIDTSIDYELLKKKIINILQ